MHTPARTRVRAWRTLFAVFVALALLATACGSDSAEPVVDTQAVDDANAAAAAAQERADELEAELEEARSAAEAAGDDSDAAAALEEAEAALADAEAAAADAESRAADAEAAAEEAAAAAASAGDGEATRSINVAVVGNPAMIDIEELTPEYFTAETGIEVNYTVLDEQTLREITTRDLGTGGDQFDVAMIGMFEAPQFGANDWLFNLNTFANNDPDYNVDDLIPAVRGGLSANGNLYAAPFYAESSFVMYRADLLEAAGQTMPEAPTWDEVAAIARAVDTDDVAGICLRGKPGWGDLGAAFTTVLNTFGGTWWSANEDGSIGTSQVDQPEFLAALDFYVDLLQDAGEDDAANSSFGECLTLYNEGKVAMWYDATVAASFFEPEVLEVSDFALAPTNVTDASGWLWAWSLAIPASSSDPATAWEYISWATSAEYHEQLAGEKGWVAVPPGTRTSLYERPEYLEAAEAFAQRTLDAMNAAPINNPGTTPRPGLPGVQYVGVPEFQDLGTRCTAEISAAIAGSQSTADAQAACHAIAQEFES
ncbi:MAG: sugar ABC transporter substrate-binding protein [Actinomycetota bacterium]